MTSLVYLSASTLPSAAANAVHVAQMCDAFAGHGCKVTLHAKRGGAGSVAAQYDLRHPFDIRYEGPVAHKLWLLGRELTRWPLAARREFYFGRRALSLSRLARAGYPVALEVHHPPRTEKQLAAMRTLVGARRFLGLVVISDRLRAEMRARLPGLDPRRVLVAHDGVRASRIREPRLTGNDPPRAVYCGSFHSGKGVETILPAAALVPEVRIDLIGGEPQQIEAMRPSAPPNVRFVGRLSHEETQRRLMEYDIALAPYGAVVRGAQTPDHESLASWMSPLKIFEYMGAGLPIVASDLPVLREILEPEATALMPPPGDPPALAEAIRRMAMEPSRRLELALAAQSHLRSYTWENRAEQILAFLEAGEAQLAGGGAGM